MQGTIKWPQIEARSARPKAESGGGVLGGKVTGGWFPHGALGAASPLPTS